METTRCPRCSKAQPSAATFCRRCGAGLRAPVAGPAATASAGSPTVRHRRPDRLALIIILAAAGVAVTLLLVVVVSRPSPSPLVVARTPDARVFRPEVALRRPSLPPLPPLPAWSRHVPKDLPPPGPGEAGRDFRGQILTQGRYLGEPLRGAVFAGTELIQAHFERADLTGADFRGADLSQAAFDGADLAGARFDGARLNQCRLVGEDAAAVAGRTRVRDGVTERVPPPPLPARNAGRASFRAARFGQTDLDGMDLAGADFRGAEFSMAGFRDADLRGADLRDTRHGMTDFQNARLDGADLRGADLTSTRNLTAEQLASAKTDATTRLPSR